ncbi:formyl transferase [Xylaria castorea]|nr:formyl transferase [Xylaria castorea]
MSYILSSLEATANSVALLFSSRSSQRISGSLLRHGRHYAIKYQQLHVATTPLFYQGRRYSTTTTPRKISDPLHILFCGSDDFSCASLKALHDEHVQNPDLIRSIDVVVRPGKRTGRGYKIVRDPPIRSLAESLGLRIHERDTFTGWDMPSKTNLIIAVSFGLFVPPRLLRGAKYGGLNLHPSLLPDLRGPAPLQHTLLAARKVTGVSLQTLDHAAFDHGVVLSQTPPYDDGHEETALRVPASVSDLKALVTPVAARMLLDGLRAGLHVPPLEDRGWKPDAAETASLVHAPKITKADRRLTSSLLLRAETETETSSSSSSSPGEEEEEGQPPSSSGTLARRQAAIGPLWFVSRDRKGRKRRVIVEALEELSAGGGVFSVVTDRPEMLTETPPALSSSSSSSPSDGIDTPLRKQYLIPFEEEQEGEEARTQKYLVFWDDPSLSRKRGHADDDDGLCLGNYRVLSLKVEGDRAKPARLALQNFILDR